MNELLIYVTNGNHSAKVYLVSTKYDVKFTKKGNLHKNIKNYNNIINEILNNIRLDYGVIVNDNEIVMIKKSDTSLIVKG